MESGKSKICRLESQKSQWGNSRPKAGRLETLERLENFRLLEEAGLFVLFSPLAELMRSTCIIAANLLYPKLTNLNLNLIQNTLQLDT